MSSDHVETIEYLRTRVAELERYCEAWAESDKRLKGLIAERDDRVAQLEAAFLAPTHWESNGEAGDGQTVCLGCGDDADEPHPWSACADRLAERLDACFGRIAELETDDNLLPPTWVVELTEAERERLVRCAARLEMTEEECIRHAVRSMLPEREWGVYRCAVSTCEQPTTHSCTCLECLHRHMRFATCEEHLQDVVRAHDILMQQPARMCKEQERG